MSDSELRNIQFSLPDIGNTEIEEVVKVMK